MDKSAFDYGIDGIAHRLADCLLRVPVFQRSYSWSQEEVEDYWNDLSRAFSKGRSPYFLGALVLMKDKDGDRLIVVDGQQRLATTAILLSVLRDAFRAAGDAGRAGIVQATYLAKPDLKSGTELPNLRLNTEDNDFYAKRIVAGEAVAPTSASHKLIEAARTYLTSKIDEAVKAAGPGAPDLLYNWVQFLQEMVAVIVLTAKDDSDAFLIYETLNDRGADLTIADLLKNYIFSRSGSRLDEARTAWTSSLAALDIGSENALFTTFLRHDWSSRHGPTRERDLYKEIKARITTENNAVDFATALQASSKEYAALLNPENDRWQPLGTSGKANVETLLRLDLEQNRPLLLAALQHFAEPELKRLLRALVGWGVRGVIVGGIGGGVAEAAYCNAATQIRTGAIKTANEVLKVITSIVPSDAEFLQAMKVARTPKPRLARYYLRVLEKVRMKEAEPELVPNTDEEQVNLEHVLPKNATGADWPTFTEDQRKDYLWRLGNLALLAKGPNGKIGNKAFAVKQPILKQSKYLLTQEIAIPGAWSPAEIDLRQTNLANDAVKAWPRAI